ncbi:SprT family protein [Numidum massiliense]|uniref:SprT family protein n=1 Tax=Numidum massiliense TaxID=1522315 RepID=UPI0006D54AF2|nr:SprT family protein [Numidum massiliense]
MDQRQLQTWVEQISLADFGLPFRHEARYNARLRTTGGRYFPHDHAIEINPKYWELGEEEVLGIIRHELCHYHLHLTGKGYKHRDPEFKALLKKVGGSRFCTPLPGNATKSRPIKYVLTCRDCRTKYYRKRKMDPRRYYCGKCSGELSLTKVSKRS